MKLSGRGRNLQPDNPMLFSFHSLSWRLSTLDIQTFDLLRPLFPSQPPLQRILRSKCKSKFPALIAIRGHWRILESVNRLLNAWRGMLACGITTVFTACGSFPPPYPANMPPLASVGGSPRFSPAISGSYLDNGKAITVEGDPRGSASLSKLLDPAGKYSGQVHVVILRGPRNAKMEIEFLRRDGTSMRVIHKQLVVERYEKYQSNGNPCRKGFIPFHIESHFNALAPLPVGFYEGRELWLAKAADGSLIILRYDSIGWWVVVPWWDSEVIWQVFSPAQSQPATAR
jgi:hypothetical protein